MARKTIWVPEGLNDEVKQRMTDPTDSYSGIVSDALAEYFEGEK